ncbi:YjbH domain-containing protein [Yoonia vestfoldensis]|uniref:YjbH domain-containing protein n=1 Tax=Yoonia vestfoldensis TaxID=245188 RepID=UPI000365646D|nr:YjbH domain-containing protein [Yoonia vestfoldensis]
MNKARFATTSVIALMAGVAAHAQQSDVNFGFNGMPGMIDMPTAQSPAKDTLAGSLAYQEGYFRATFTYQLTDRATLAARYSVVDLYGNPTSTIIDGEFERSFDLHYRLLDESAYLPALAFGLRDVFTPGRFASEYVVATKSFGDNLTVTAGLGWGAMATRDGFDNPLSGLGARPVFDDADPEGQLGSDYWFRGDAAAFGGLTYQINDRWGVVAEYSTIAYPEQPFSPALETDTRYNLGVTYRPNDSVQLSFASLSGRNVGVSGTFSLNANNRPAQSGSESAPTPVKLRDVQAAQSWNRATEPGLRAATSQLLQMEGQTLTGLEMTDTTARVRYVNGRYRSQAQAMGRVARLLTQVMPDSIDTFILEPEARGIGLSAVTIARSDIERLENRPGAAESLRAGVAFGDAWPADSLADARPARDAFQWGFGPYLTINPFGGDGNIAVSAGLSLRGVYQITPQLIASGAIVQSVLKADRRDPGSDSTPDIQNVRTDSQFYGDDGLPVLQALTLSHYGRPGTDLYSRVSLGYLESMFGGVSTEVLWKPVDSAFGLGVELNYVAQRDTDMLLGFDEYDYDVLTGHLSAYYDFGNGYHTQLDVGRYLAGDWGATLSLDREYSNGIRVGAYVTQTDISYDDFGDGSYNKGVRISIPQDFFIGDTSRGTYGTQVRTRSGDGGARLSVDGRLYDVVRDAHEADLTDTWGRFWR